MIIVLTFTIKHIHERDNMSNILKKLTEEHCMVAIEELMKEGLQYLNSEKFDKSSYCFFRIAQIIKSIPSIRRKKLLNDLSFKRQKNSLNKDKE